MRVLIVLVALTASAAARADDRTAAITTQPLALVGRGATVGYERALPHRFSIVGQVGGRAAALGDYSSTTLTAGVELRLWPLARAGRRLRRLYVALHASAGRTELADDTIDTRVGASVELTERIDVGWRFVVWRRLSLAPVLGAGVHHDLDLTGRFAPNHAPTVMIGFELGVLL